MSHLGCTIHPVYAGVRPAPPIVSLADADREHLDNAGPATRRHYALLALQRAQVRMLEIVHQFRDVLNPNEVAREIRALQTQADRWLVEPAADSGPGSDACEDTVMRGAVTDDCPEPGSRNPNPDFAHEALGVSTLHDLDTVG